MSFMINLNTMKVHDKFQNNRFSVPRDILSVAKQLKYCMGGLVGRRKEAGKVRRCREAAFRLQKEREEHRN
ncbi:hypothetical protein K503DRAFT_764802, partial [Rhizopogon vinicolor AM-OR11-026]